MQQNSWIQSSQTGGRPYSEITDPYEESECSLAQNGNITFELSQSDRNRYGGGRAVSVLALYFEYMSSNLYQLFLG